MRSCLYIVVDVDACMATYVLCARLAFFSSIPVLGTYFLFHEICVLYAVFDAHRNAADKVVKGQGKYEELVVCSQEIAASTTQLVVASKVKASRGSENLQQLAVASKGVTSATGQVVASAKSAAQRIEEMGECILTFHLITNKVAVQGVGQEPC
jgi:I/LWEQ domain